MGRPLPPDLARLVEQLNDAACAYFERNMEIDAKTGSPDPVQTALARVVAHALTFARVGLAHSSRNDAFETVLTMARELEASGWTKHRAECGKCGGH